MTESVLETTAADAVAASSSLGAAQAILAVLPIDEPLVAGQPGRSVLTLDGQAVSVRFTGSISGELLIAVDQPVLDALASSPLGPLDPTQALKPALEAAVQTIGSASLGPVKLVPVAAALDGLLAKPGALLVPLLAGAQVRAIVGLAVSEDPGVAAPVAAQLPAIQDLARPGGSGGARDLSGLDFLREVQMDVTAELGRTRLTLNELLALTDGAVIELDQAAGSPADLLVNGRLIARGEVVVIDENFGLRITEIVSEHGTR
jgi:flagellar motor switch protein FliN/FliY